MGGAAATVTVALPLPRQDTSPCLRLRPGSRCFLLFDKSLISGDKSLISGDVWIRFPSSVLTSWGACGRVQPLRMAQALSTFLANALAWG